MSRNADSTIDPSREIEVPVDGVALRNKRFRFNLTPATVWQGLRLLPFAIASLVVASLDPTDYSDNDLSG